MMREERGGDLLETFFPGILSTLKVHLCFDHVFMFLYSVSAFLSIGGIKITAFDLGPEEVVTRRVLRDFIPSVDAIVFVFDVSDRNRMADAKKEFDVSDSELNLFINLNTKTYVLHRVYYVTNVFPTVLSWFWATKAISGADCPITKC